MKRMLLLLLSSVLFSTSLFANQTSQSNQQATQLVVGRQYDAHKYLWKPASVGESNSNYLDIVNRFAESIGATVTYRYFRERDDLLKALYMRELDLVVGYSPSIDGSLYFSYSQPIFDIQSVVWFHNFDLRTKPTNSLRWGCVRSSLYCDVLSNQGVPNLTVYKTERAMMQSLSVGEIEAIYTDVVASEQYLSERIEGEWSGFINYDPSLPDFHASMVIGKWNTQLYAQVEEYLTSVSPLLTKNQRTLIDPLGTETLLKVFNLESGDKVVRYTLENNMRPFSYESSESDKHVGYFHDLMSLISRKSGIQFEYVPQGTRTPLEMLEAGLVDLVPSIIGGEREGIIHTKAFSEIKWVKIESKQKSGHGRIGILDRTGRGRIQFDSPFVANEDLIYLDEPDALISAMDYGALDYAFVPSYVLDYFMYGQKSDIFSIVLEPHMTSLMSPIGFELKSTNVLLKSVMNEALNLISANELEMLHMKHHRIIAQYGYDKSHILNIALSLLSFFLLVVVGYQTKANRLSKSLLEADEVVAQNKQRLRWLSDLLDRLPSMIAIYDESNQLVLSNKAFKKHGMRCKNFQTGQCLLKQQSSEFDAAYQHVCQCRYSRRYLRIIEDEIGGMNDDGRYRLMVYDDYTKLERQKEQLKTSNREALKAIKSRDLFLATISHELRTPIAAMIGMMELMDGKVESVENTELLSNAQMSANRLRLLVNDILDISKIEANQFHLDVRNGNVYSELGSLLRTYESNAEMKNLSFALNWVPTPYAYASSDWLRVTQILNNLLSNAVKFTQLGGIAVTVELNSKQLIVEVKDTGCGMTTEQQSRIFTPFAQGDVSITRKYGGSGLGLSIVKSIVEMMDGSIDIVSEHTIGTLMKVKLPVMNAAKFDGSNHVAVSTNESIQNWLTAWQVQNRSNGTVVQINRKNTYPDLILTAIEQNEQSSPAKESARVLRSANIVVVDDDPINRLLFAKQLTKLNIQAVFACDGVEAIEFITQHHSEIDLILTDCHMPNMDGYELTERIKADSALKHLPVIGCTAEDSKTVVEKAAAVGMDHVVYKPYTIDELSIVLEKYLGCVSHEEAQNQPSVNSDLAWLNDYDKHEQKEVMGVVLSAFIAEREMILKGEALPKVIHRLKGSASMLSQHTLVALALEWEEQSIPQQTTDTNLIVEELNRLIDTYETWLTC